MTPQELEDLKAFVAKVRRHLVPPCHESPYAKEGMHQLCDGVDRLLAETARLRAAAELVLGDWANVKARDALRAALEAKR